MDDDDDDDDDDDGDDGDGDDDERAETGVDARARCDETRRDETLGKAGGVWGTRDGS